MKKITIKNATKLTVLEKDGEEYTEIEGNEGLSVSDGYHTIDELYEHRIVLYIALCAAQRLFTDKEVWRSKLHSDGSGFEGWFILGIGQKKGSQITYHIPLSYWDQTNFAVTLDQAPEWDGHTSVDVLKRLKVL